MQAWDQNPQGTPEEIAEQLVKQVDGGDIKKMELERRHAEIKPGQPGSGVERNSAAAAAQVQALHIHRHAFIFLTNEMREVCNTILCAVSPMDTSPMRRSVAEALVVHTLAALCLDCPALCTNSQLWIERQTPHVLASHPLPRKPRRSSQKRSRAHRVEVGLS